MATKTEREKKKIAAAKRDGYDDYDWEIEIHQMGLIVRNSLFEAYESLKFVYKGKPGLYNDPELNRAVFLEIVNAAKKAI